MKRWSLAIFMLVLGLGGGSALVGTLLHGQNVPGNVPAAVLPREFTSYRDVVKRVLPAVVSIETRAKARVNPRLNAFPFDDPENRGLPGEPSRIGFGSGFFVDPAGVVVTNYHVVEGADTAVVQLQDGRKFTSKTIRIDRRTDLALILLDVKDGRFPTLEFGDSDAMEIGDRVLAVGAPFGLAGSVTHGIISAKGRNGLNMNMYEDFLQTDAAINPGNSGGPLVNLEGKVVGINAAIKSKSGGFQGVGLAVASNLARNVVQALRTNGSVRRGYLGVQVRELDAAVASRLGVPKDTGVVVGEVFENTPAAKGGVKAGDIILRIAGKNIRDGKMLQSVVAGLPIAKQAAVEVFRDGKAQNLNVTIEEQPAAYGTGSVPAPRNASPAPNSVRLDALGIDVADLTPELADDLGYRKEIRGVVVTRIDDNGIAADSGLRRGMVITRIDKQSVTSTAAVRKAVQAANLARGVLLQTVTPQGGVNYIVVRAERQP